MPAPQKKKAWRNLLHVLLQSHQPADGAPVPGALPSSPSRKHQPGAHRRRTTEEAPDMVLDVALAVKQHNASSEVEILESDDGDGAGAGARAGSGGMAARSTNGMLGGSFGGGASSGRSLDASPDWQGGGGFGGAGGSFGRAGGSFGEAGHASPGNSAQVHPGSPASVPPAVAQWSRADWLLVAKALEVSAG